MKEKTNIDGLEIRELYTEDDIEQCIKLQEKIWGLDALGQMSPITMKALIAKHPALGFVTAAFLKDKMIALQIVLASVEPKTVYGHMLGILEEYRSMHIGAHMQKHLFGVLQAHDIERMLWTYEPLEGRNANNYLDKSGGRVIQYLPDYYHVKNVMSGGMPIDRFLAEIRLDDEYHKSGQTQRDPGMNFDDAMLTLPIASKNNMPDAFKVLVEIPADLQQLKHENMEEAIRFRMDTREIFSEYINNRGYFSQYLYSGVQNGERRNYYLLQKQED
jgi:predicted GNAT superfamily acetyltransferase